LRRIHKVIAVGASSLLLLLALTPAALAAGTARSGVGGAAGRAITLPNSNIKGRPAHFSPSTLTAKARWRSTICRASQASFTLNNRKGSARTVTFTGAASGMVKVPAHKKEDICVRKGDTGKLVGKLRDGKKLIVHLL
jgi:hypothetical protein